MQKVIFGIFAHPDDEAFGPGGTLIQETDAGAELHLITLTAGDAGRNPDNYENLAEKRLEEWRAAGKILGASSMTFLDYKDGKLSNTFLIEIVPKIVEIIEKKTLDQDCEIELMSFEFGGISGHIDHIVAARAAAHAFYMKQPVDPRFSRLRLFCLPRSLQPSPDTSWLFMDHGYSDTEISEVIDVTPAYERRVAAIQAHKSQRVDGKYILKRFVDTTSQYDYFIVRH